MTDLDMYVYDKCLLLKGKNEPLVLVTTGFILKGRILWMFAPVNSLACSSLVKLIEWKTKLSIFWCLKSRFYFAYSGTKIEYLEFTPLRILTLKTFLCNTCPVVYNVHKRLKLSARILWKRNTIVVRNICKGQKFSFVTHDARVYYVLID